MDIGAITTLISTVGFPIAAVIALAFFIWRIYRRSEEREATLMTEIKETREVNAKAIDTIAHYAEKLDSIQNDIKEIKTDVTVLMSK
jgi:chromosome segregation ATPase